jgi:hypothetical protein
MYETGRADPNAPRGWGWVIGMLVLFVVLVWPAILAGGGGTSQANDMVDYHAIEIRRLAAQWPTPDLRESFTTTTPGFHLVLAVVAKLGGGLLVQRLVASLAGWLAWLVTWRMAAAWCSARVAAVLAAPVALSPYLLGATVWMTTDAAALALAAATMGVALVARNEVRMSRVAGLLGAGTVLVRQIMLWASVPAALRVLFDRACQEYDRLGRDRADPVREALETFDRGLEGLDEPTVDVRLAALERQLREIEQGGKLYGHLFDDVLALKYLHQRYTNYRTWLRAGGASTDDAGHGSASPTDVEGEPSAAGGAK